MNEISFDSSETWQRWNEVESVNAVNFTFRLELWNAGTAAYLHITSSVDPLLNEYIKLAVPL